MDFSNCSFKKTNLSLQVEKDGVKFTGSIRFTYPTVSSTWSWYPLWNTILSSTRLYTASVSSPNSFWHKEVHIKTSSTTSSGDAQILELVQQSWLCEIRWEVRPMYLCDQWKLNSDSKAVCWYSTFSLIIQNACRQVIWSLRYVYNFSPFFYSLDMIKYLIAYLQQTQFTISARLIANRALWRLVEYCPSIVLCIGIMYIALHRCIFLQLTYTLWFKRHCFFYR